MTRESIEYDIVIVGGGPAGLSAAIRAKQVAQSAGREVSVCILEKGAEIGSHILSGAVFETTALDELIPNWRQKGAPICTSVTNEKLLFLTTKRSLKLPHSAEMKNGGNYIISLGELCRWLASEAETMGVEIFSGFAAADYQKDDNGKICGVIVNDFGIGKDGTPKPGYQPGVVVRGKYHFISEGCRGSLAEKIIADYALNSGRSPQTYALGVKEVWEINPPKHVPGKVVHTVGWPLNSQAYGGGFIYHAENNRLNIGIVVGLDYANPTLDPFMELQRLKMHPAISSLLEGGRRVSYGARCLNEGGLQSVPNLTFPGGAIIGCSAGFVNIGKIKGIHNAMKTGMLAAEAAVDQLVSGTNNQLYEYQSAFEASWVHHELKRVRNLRPAFKKFGLYGGMAYAFVDSILLRGKTPWTLRWNKRDNQSLRSTLPAIEYPKPDGIITFDKLSSVHLTGTFHEEDQPIHLRLKDDGVPQSVNLPLYKGPEQYYCPAAVYEYIEVAGAKKLKINAQNCIHCKTCDIKDPTQNIVWSTPQGGEGPKYGLM
jgi:electron-transferring-flavoprotein dehydrogenase